MNIQDFISAGYKKISVGIEDKWADSACQISLTNKNGIMYYITVYFSKPFVDVPSKPVAKAQFEIGRQTLNLELFNIESTESCNKFFDVAWNALGANYYQVN